MQTDVLSIDAEMDEVDLARWYQEEALKEVRKLIQKEAGDTLSLLGTASDGASLALLSTIAHTVAVDSSPSYKEYRENYLTLVEGISAGGGVVDASKQFLAGVEARKVLLPPMAKGFSEVIQDIIGRGASVTRALISYRRGE